MERSPFVRGQLSLVSAGRDRKRKQSQTKPLISSALESVRYTVSGQNKAIDVNRLFFSYLRGQKADFSTRMNGASVSQVPNWLKPEIGNSKLEARNWKMERRNWKMQA
jgi:hypothetical protein